MKQFFKYVFATITGIIISFFLIIIIGTAIIAGMVSTLGNKNTVVVTDNSILMINLNYTITERSSKNPLQDLDIPGISTEKTLGLNDILANIKAAKTDNHIKGIYLDLQPTPGSFATLQEIRDALIDFKRSKKFIIAYSEIYTQGIYYLASVADKVYLNPAGEILFNGFSASTMFYKGLFEKLGVEAQVFKVGTYKSAVEPYILDKMSDANREQVNSFLGDIYHGYLTNIAKTRNINPDSLFSIANELKVRKADDAVKYHLIDALKYKDQVLDELRTRLKLKKEDDINTVSIAKYDPETPVNSAKDRIAVVYAVGEIVSGEGSDETIGSERISRSLRQVRKDDKVKAVVLRVNSPGGSALASDIIWREVMLTKKVKPIIVSMGDVAASGGYYISAAADSIIAQPNTITGSIGIFGIYPNLQGFFNDKLGITFDVVKTGKYADLGDISRPVTADERAIIQGEVNKGYQTFTQKVADGRKMTQPQVDQIGQGRVWTGSQALQIGLVDRLGNFNEAIKSAAKKAKLKDYRIVSYPAIKDPIQELLRTGSEQVKNYFTKQELGVSYPYYVQAKKIIQQSGIQARLPFVVDIR
ncbi:protease-4 [bacterium A37T11]|nr:protease-4 [bacterium A37T11]